MSISKILKRIERIQKDIKYLSSRAINDIAFDVQKSENAHIGKLKAKKMTQRAYLVKKSDKRNLTAKVYMKEDWHYIGLAHHYKGSEAIPIEFEHWLVDMGWMTDNQMAVPIKRMTRAGYAKVEKGLTSPKSDIFVVPVGNTRPQSRWLYPGIYKRLKRKVKPLIVFTPTVRYKKRLEFKKTADKVLKRRTTKYFQKWIREVLQN